jgi:hypothetical protein
MGKSFLSNVRDEAADVFDAPFKPPAGMSVARAALTTLARTRNVVVALTPYTDIVVTNASFGRLGYDTIEDTVSAATAATRGSSRKSVVVGLGSAAVASVDGSATDDIPVFGWRVRASASVNNNTFRPILIDVGLIATAAGPVFSCASPVFSIACFPRRLPLDVFVLATANAGGVATIVPGTSGSLGVGGTSTTPGCLVRSLSDANYVVTIESFNSRELISRDNRVASIQFDDKAYIEAGQDSGVYDR